MRHLNYNHLLYFWTVAREGSIARAAESLHLTPQTISTQLKQLEKSIGQKLFQRSGRGLALTAAGKIVNEYAAEIFELGTELAHRLRGSPANRPDILHVGIVNSIPKLVACRVLEPALRSDASVRVVCVENDLGRLLGDLSVHRLDLVLSDRPLPPGLNIKAYNHPLGHTAVFFFAQRRSAARFSRSFPASLNGAPMLLPTESMAIRRGIDEWLDRHELNPRIVAEFDDSALLKAFGDAGFGVFPGSAAIAPEIESMYGSRVIGEADGVAETYFAISPERKLKHEAVVAITEAARKRVFN